jgi:hypothetical protein
LTSAASGWTTVYGASGTRDCTRAERFHRFDRITRPAAQQHATRPQAGRWSSGVKNCTAGSSMSAKPPGVLRDADDLGAGHGVAADAHAAAIASSLGHQSFASVWFTTRHEPTCPGQRGEAPAAE